MTELEAALAVESAGFDQACRACERWHTRVDPLQTRAAWVLFFGCEIAGILLVIVGLARHWSGLVWLGCVLLGLTLAWCAAQTVILGQARRQLRHMHDHAERYASLLHDWHRRQLPPPEQIES